MNRQQKELVVKTLKERFEESNASFLVGVQGLTVKQTRELRSQLRAKDGHLSVAKVRLMRRAVDNTVFSDGLVPYLKDQLGFVFAEKEPSAVAKVLYDFSKKNKALNLVAGCFESQVLDKNTVVRIASLPSREVLLAQLCGTLKAPIASLARVLHMIEQAK